MGKAFEVISATIAASFFFAAVCMLAVFFRLAADNLAADCGARCPVAATMQLVLGGVGK